MYLSFMKIAIKEQFVDQKSILDYEKDRICIAKKKCENDRKFNLNVSNSLEIKLKI